MKHNLLLVLITIPFFCCDNPDVESVKEETTVYQAAYVASLVAGFKYRRFEEPTIERPYSIAKIELRWDTAGILPLNISLDKVHTGRSLLSIWRFMYDAVDGGPFGNVPYEVDAISIFIPRSSGPYTDPWYWDEKRETLAVKGPLNTFS